MENNKFPEGKYIGTVRIGPKGQIVIPGEIRRMLGLKPGDGLIIMADVDRGIAMQTYDCYDRMTDGVFGGEGTRERDEGNEIFVGAVREVIEKERETKAGENDENK